MVSKQSFAKLLQGALNRFGHQAAQAGVPSWKIRQQTGHASDAMLVRYIRDGELFLNNVVDWPTRYFEICD